MPSATIESGLNFYEILQLPRDERSTISAEQVKAAYHRALLLHHPDKSQSTTIVSVPKALESRSKSRYTVDEIVAAFRTLSDPVTQKDYDEILERRKVLVAGTGPVVQRGTHIGVDIFDLEDLTYDEDAGVWHRQCRCGYQQSYVVTEAELERESSHGEIYVGCRGCSLSIKVLFSSADAEDSSTV